MSGGKIRKVSLESIQMVQNMIEQCLPYYMTQKQVVDVIYQQQKIEPSFTYLVWQKLEEENEEFFKGYYMRLILTEQIAEYNKLLVRQATLMHLVSPTGPAPAFQPVFDGPLPHYASENPAVVLQRENVRWPVTAGPAGGFTGGMLAGVPPDVLLARHANGGGGMMMMTTGGTNGVPIKTEAGGYLGGSGFVLAADGCRHVVEARGDPSLSSFSSIESNSHLLNGSLVDDTSSFGAFGPMPSSYDMLESFPTPGFLPSDRDNFMDSHGSTVDHQGETNGLDAISEILRFEDFGSDSYDQTPKTGADRCK